MPSNDEFPFSYSNGVILIQANRKKVLSLDWHLINSDQSLFSRSESEREKWRKQWRPCRRSFPFSPARHTCFRAPKFPVPLPLLTPATQVNIFAVTTGKGFSHAVSLPADVPWGSFVTHSFLPHGWGRNECVTNEPQRTSAGRLRRGLILRLLRYKITVYVCIYVCHLCGLSGHVDYVFIPKKKSLWIVIEWDNLKQRWAKRICKSSSSSHRALQR